MLKFDGLEVDWWYDQSFSKKKEKMKRIEYFEPPTVD